MSKLRINSLVNRNDDGAPELSKGAVVPANQTFTVNGNLNVVGVVTASNFVGNGSGLTGLTIASPSRAIAYKLIFDPLPFRS